MSRALLIGERSALSLALAAALERTGLEVEVADPAAINVGNRTACERVVAQVQPRAVIDVSARPSSRVPEADVAAANVARAATESGALLVHLSGPEVFDGASGRPYLESDAPSPATALGRRRASAEAAAALAAPVHAIVRTGWLHGSDPSGPVASILREAAGGSVEADAGTIVSPTYLPHVAELVARLVQRPSYGVFHLAGSGEPCTQAGFAQAVLRAARSPARVTPRLEGGRQAGGGNQALASCRDELPPMPDWRLGVAACLEAVADGRTTAPASDR